MSQDDQLIKLSRRAYLSYHQDGLIDILIGLGFLGFGLMMFFDNVVFNMLAWMPIIFYVPFKNRITVPRFGYVQFSSERTKNLRLLLILAAGLLLLVGLYFFAVYSDMPPLIETLTGGDGMLVIGGLFGLMLIVAGLVTRLDRLFVYAFLALVILPSGALLGIKPAVRVILVGTLILSIGIILLVRFVRAYLLPKDESA